MLPRTQGLKDRLQREISANAPRAHLNRLVYFRVVHAVMRESDLLNPSYYKGSDSHARLTSMIQALARIAMNCNRRLRNIEGWCLCDSTASRNLSDQFDSLIQHLFVKYPVPRFMNHVWFEGGEGVKIFLKMAINGFGPRQCGLPFRLNKAMAREFMLAPDDLNIWQAIRWAQVLSLGGSKKLARLILPTRLNERQNEESYWIEIIEFLCRAEQDGLAEQNGAPVLADEEVETIIDFVQKHRFEPAYRLLGFQFGNNLTMQPNFSLKRRTLRWFRRHQANWRNEIELPKFESPTQHKGPAWLPMGLAGMRVETESEIWVIEELLTAHQLRVEGGIMRHCVATYDGRCKNGHSSIWSMRVIRDRTVKRVLTIEINPYRKRVVHASGKGNSAPSTMAYRMLKRWAADQDLAVNF